MTSRLQSLTVTTEKKDSEILEMRQTIELLRKQSIQAGLTTAHMQSMGGNQINGNSTLPTASSTPKTASLNSVATDPHSTTPPLPPANGSSMIPRHHSSESMCSINSISSGSSAQDKKKKKGWLRSSFNLSKAFSRNAKISKTSRHYLTNDLSVNTTIPETSICSTLPPSSPANGSPMKMNHQNDAVDADPTEVHPIVEDLKKQLREKDLVLTDIRLEALSSASQLENLKDTVQQMRQEMMSLKQNNDRLQRMVTTRSLAGSEASLGHHSGTPASPSGSIGEPRRYSLAENGMSRQVGT
jgi:neuron navigator 2